MKSGILAAQATFTALTAAAPQHTSSSRQLPVDISSYQAAIEESYVWDELRDSRNIRPGYVLDVFRDGIAIWCLHPAQLCPQLTTLPCPALPEAPCPAFSFACFAVPCCAPLAGPLLPYLIDL